MKIAMAQINPIVGDLEGNVEKIRLNSENLNHVLNLTPGTKRADYWRF